MVCLVWCVWCGVSGVVYLVWCVWCGAFGCGEFGCGEFGVVCSVGRISIFICK